MKAHHALGYLISVLILLASGAATGGYAEYWHGQAVAMQAQAPHPVVSCNLDSVPYPPVPLSTTSKKKAGG